MNPTFATDMRTEFSRFLTAIFVAVAGASAAEPDLVEFQAAVPQRHGLVLHLGPTDGSLGVALAKAHPVVVMAVSGDPSTEARVREAFSAAGVLGQATVTGFAGRVPMADDSAAVTIADLDALPGLTQAEALRVTRPFGRVWLRQGGRWQTLDKPRPEGADDWGQYQYDAAMSDHSRDVLAGPAQGIQWVAGPQAIFSDGVRIAGAVALFQDEGKALLARDAFSGLPLWRRPDLKPATRFTLILDQERVYIHPIGEHGLPAPAMLALDARTGETLMTYTEGIRSFVPPEGGWPRNDRDGLRTAAKATSEHLQARLSANGRLLQVAGSEMVMLDAASGRRLWAASAGEGWIWGHPIVAEGTVYAVEGPGARSWSYTHWPMVGIQRIQAFDAATGEPRWTYTAPVGRDLLAAYNMTHGAGRLALACRTRLDAKSTASLLILDAASGSETAYLPDGIPSERGQAMVVGGGHSSIRATIIGDRLHLSSITQLPGSISVTNPVPETIERPFAGTGRPVGCTVFRSTPNWVYGSLTTYGVDGDSLFHTSAARTVCDVGAFPANGLSYITPNHCFCLPYLPGSMAFHPRPFAGLEAIERLETGPARPASKPLLSSATHAWPMFLANNQRGAWVDDPLPAELSQIWQVKPAGEAMPPDLIREAWASHWYAHGPVTQASVADGLVVLGVAHRQQIAAYDAATGAERWRANVDGRIDTAPTIAGGLVVAGTRTGWVYALELASGELAWRFFAAPRRDRIIVDGQPESPWPLHGSLNVTEEGVWAVAGRHGSSDGGLFWWQLDLATGAVRAQGRLGHATLPDKMDWSSIMNNPAVLDRGLFQIPGKTLRVTADGLADWTTPYTPEGGRWQEADGWRERFARGVLTPGNQGILAKVEHLGGYKLAQYGFTSARMYVHKGDEFAMVGGAPTMQHRGGDGNSVLRRMRRLPELATFEAPHPKDPARTVTRLLGARELWMKGDLDLWRGAGLCALAMAGDALVLAGEVTNRDRWRERQEMPYRLRLFHEDTGELRQDDLSLPARAVYGGISSDDGRVFVVSEDGSLTAFGAGTP